MAVILSPDNAKTPQAADVHVGSRIRLRRLMLGITQEKLGEASGICFQQIQKYESGVNRVGSSRLHQIATTLSVPPSFFFEDLPNSTPPAEHAEAKALAEFVSTHEGV